MKAESGQGEKISQEVSRTAGYLVFLQAVSLYHSTGLCSLYLLLIIVASTSLVLVLGLVSTAVRAPAQPYCATTIE